MSKEPRKRKVSKSSTRGGIDARNRGAAHSSKRSKSPRVAKKAKAGDAGHSRAERFPIVGLGASAGGLEAFMTFLKALTPNTGMGFILIQHMDPTHESILASLLQRVTSMPIRDASDGTIVAPNHVYILPPGSLMTISGGVLSLTSRRARSFKDYPIDQFFVSLAEDLRHRAIGVVLSGTASDGTRGLLAIKAEGGITFAQDTESAQFSSMPANAVASGCVDFTLSPDDIARALPRINGHPYMRRAPAAEQSAIPSGADGLLRILRQLRATTGVDFELYKPAMIARRIARRMALHKLETHGQYFALIQKNPAELNALYEDIFIHVTGFFRDPESLQALKRRVLNNFIPDKTSRTIRIWVPGCATGEEVYSLAMLLFETLGKRRAKAAIHIFGTDISERSVQKARAGIYPPSAIVDVSPDRQRRFFSRVEENFQITKAIRDVCVFARHDLSNDPPFSRMDLISCRNVLIYMGPQLQKKVIEAFHYALKPRGHLLLGKSESLSSYSNLFVMDDSKHKILLRRSLDGPVHVHTGSAEKEEAETAPALLRTAPPAPDTSREAERLLLDRYAPPAIVVDSNLRIVHFQGNTGPFLSPSAGEPSFHLVRMIRPELLVDLRSAVYQARKEGGPVHKDGISFIHNGESSTVAVTVAPMKAPHGKNHHYLIVFRESVTPASAPKKTGGPQKSGDRAKAALVRKELEIASLRQQLQALMQDHEAADEEMRLMNEEILSSNEELQSTNEELETAKEELESTNEELTTLNDELQKRNAELSQTTDDLNNVLVTTDIPIVILDSDQRIRRFTPAAGHVLNLIASDIGRPLSDIASTLPSINWRELTARAAQQVQPIESEVQDKTGRWYTLRVRPYRSGMDRVDGTLIALLDVDMVKRSMEEIERARRHAQDLEARIALAGNSMRIGMWEYDMAIEEVRGTPQWSALYGAAPQQAMSRQEWMARVHPEDRAAIEAELEQVIKAGEVSSLQYRVVWPDGSVHWLNRRAELVRDERGHPVRLRGVSIDITEQKQAEEERRGLVSRIASAQDLERRRIARELHDGLIQDLAGIAMELGHHAATLPARAHLRRSYKAIQNRIVEAAELARHVAYELHPTELDDLGLEKALRRYCEQLANENDIVVECDSCQVPPGLDRDVVSCLYRVAQESLRNIIKHSNATRARVSMETTDTEIKLRVEDNGKGLLLSALPNSGGLGVASMRERVQLVNGRFTITSKPGQGTTVMADIPLQRADAGAMLGAAWPRRIRKRPNP